MRVLYARCAGLDVHKDQVTSAVRSPGGRPSGRVTEARRFWAFYGVFSEMDEWLFSQGVTRVTMEVTGGVFDAGVACAA